MPLLVLSPTNHQLLLFEIANLSTHIVGDNTNNGKVRQIFIFDPKRTFSKYTVGSSALSLIPNQLCRLQIFQPHFSYKLIFKYSGENF